MGRTKLDGEIQYIKHNLLKKTLNITKSVRRQSLKSLESQVQMQSSVNVPTLRNVDAVYVYLGNNSYAKPLPSSFTFLPNEDVLNKFLLQTDNTAGYWAWSQFTTNGAKDQQSKFTRQAKKQMVITCDDRLVCQYKPSVFFLGVS